MDLPPVLVTDVFTPGRSPIFTYNPRDERNLEGSIRRHVQTPGSAVVISGPTKSGKTVVVERILPQDVAVWVNGSDLRTLDDLWAAVVEFLGLYTDLTVQAQSGDTTSAGITGTLGVPGVGTLAGQIGTSGSETGVRSQTVRRRPAAVARAALKDVDLPIVIDDFHYVHSDLQVELTRAIKTLVPDNAVVLVAVPQDAFSAVRAETDMLGRVVQIAIEPWTEGELRYIAEQGFAALNLHDESSTIGVEFARHSLGAPYLMQQLCLEYCLNNEFDSRQGELTAVQLPTDLLKFYASVASRNVPGVFDALKAGPKTKGQPRLPRYLKTGDVTDIYGAVLFGISKMGPVRAIPIQPLVHKIAEYFVDPPKSQNVAFALGQMSQIAHKNRRGSDPVLDFKDDVLYIGDPFLSFYLRFGEWELPRPPENFV